MSELIARARAFDVKMRSVEAERERVEAVYRRTLRLERSRLCDVDAERLRSWLFNRWIRERALPDGKELTKKV